MSLLREQQIRLPRRRQIRHPIPSIKHRRSRLIRMLLKVLRIRSNSQRLVMSEVTLVMELDLPPSFLFNLLRRPMRDFVAHDFDVVAFWPDEVDEQSADDGRHAGGEDDDGDAGVAGPFVEVVEVGVEFYVGAEGLDAFGEGRFDAVHHGAEGVPATYNTSDHGNFFFFPRPSLSGAEIDRTEKCLSHPEHPCCLACEDARQIQGCPSEGYNERKRLGSGRL